MVVGTILKFGGLAAGFIFFGLFASRSVQIGIGPAAKEIADSIGSFGQGIGEVGSGAAALGTGIGTGISGLFAPFITLFKLFNPTQATAQNNALNSATQPNTFQQSNTKASKAGSFVPSTISGGGSSLVTGFLAGPGGL